MIILHGTCVPQHARNTVTEIITVTDIGNAKSIVPLSSDELLIVYYLILVNMSQ